MSSSVKKALYAGSFDPFTKGHLEIVKRALNIFDEVIIVVAISPNKKTLFSLEERTEMLRELFIDESFVKVDYWDGLIVDYAKKNGVSSIIRGLRPTGDFDGEFQMAVMNRKLSNNIDTVFFMTDIEQCHISSSSIKEVFHHGGDVSDYVPSKILKYLKDK